MANFYVETSSCDHGESIIRTKWRAAWGSGTSRDPDRAGVDFPDECLDKWRKPFIPAIGKAGTDGVRVRAST